MTRNKYIMKIDEIQTLVAGIISHGPEETYDMMRAKALFAMKDKNDIDEMFLDMSETLLKRARDEDENDSDENPSLANTYLTLSFMLRKIGHEVYRKYIRKGDKRDNERFLRLISYNKNISLMI